MHQSGSKQFSILFGSGSRWYLPHQLDQSGRASSRSLYKVGPFDVIVVGKHLGAWGRGAQLTFFIVVMCSFSATIHAQGLVPCITNVRGFETVQQADTRRCQLENVSMSGPH